MDKDQQPDTHGAQQAGQQPDTHGAVQHVSVTPPVSVIAECGVTPPHGKHSSGQLCRRKDGSVALQWVTSTKTDYLSKVPRTPDGRDICWAQWCHVPCDKSSCPDWHAETFEELQAALVIAGRDDGDFPAEVQALACERMGLRHKQAHMRDLVVAQVWLRAMLAQLYVASGQDERISGCGAVTPLQVSMAIGSDVQSYVGPAHVMGVALVQYGQIALDSGKPMVVL